LVLLALLGVIERRVLRILPGRIRNSIHVDDMIAILVGCQSVLEQLTAMANIAALSVGEKALPTTVETTVRADGRAKACAPVVRAFGALVPEHAFGIG
jgi:hypothetical protein